jgi:hypothetical protein
LEKIVSRKRRRAEGNETTAAGEMVGTTAADEMVGFALKNMQIRS